MEETATAAGDVSWVLVGIGVMILGLVIAYGVYQWHMFRKRRTAEDQLVHRKGTEKVYREADRERN